MRSESGLNAKSQEVRVNVISRRHPYGFSMERLFEIVIEHLPPPITASPLKVPFHSRGFFKRFGNLAWAMFHSGDVNHVTGEVHYIVLALPPKRTILTVHDCGTIVGKKPTLKRHLYKWIWFTLPVRRARLVTTISETARRDLLEITGCPKEKIVVIPNCIDPRFRPGTKPFNSSKPRILQVGRAPNKNIPRLAEALRGIPCHLHIVGIPDAQTRRVLECNHIEYSHNDMLSFEQLLNEYHSADLVTFVSTFEGFGLPVLEAQATGRPLVTSNISPMKEIAGTGAVLVDPFDVNSIARGIIDIIEHEETRSTLIQQGFRNVSQYSPSRTAAQYARLYQALAGGTPWSAMSGSTD